MSSSSRQEDHSAQTLVIAVEALVVETLEFPPLEIHHDAGVLASRRTAGSQDLPRSDRQPAKEGRWQGDV